MFMRVSRSALRPAFARGIAIPASQFKSEKDPKFLEFQSTSAIENLYEFGVKNIAQYNIELRKLADLKVNDTLKANYEVMKSKLIVPDANTIEILVKSAEADNVPRAILIFDDVCTFQIDPTPETYKTLAGVFKAGKQNDVADLLTKMAKAECRYDSDEMVTLMGHLSKLAHA